MHVLASIQINVMNEIIHEFTVRYNLLPLQDITRINFFPFNI